MKLLITLISQLIYRVEKANNKNRTAEEQQLLTDLKNDLIAYKAKIEHLIAKDS